MRGLVVRTQFTPLDCIWLMFAVLGVCRSYRCTVSRFYLSSFTCGNTLLQDGLPMRERQMLLS